MNKWETAKAQLDSMVFPSQRFKERDKESRESREVSEKQVFGVYTYSRSHRQKKGNHNGTRTKISGLLNVNGFETEFIRDYCFECKKVVKLEGIMFNDELNVCYIKTFIEDKEINPSDVFDGGLDL